MNELVVPPAPHWYKSSVMACAPDGTLVYGSKNDIVVLQEQGAEEPAQIRVINGAHSRPIVSVSLNRKWDNPNCYIASLGEDNVVRIWNLKTFEKKTSNKEHKEHKEAVIGAVFAGDDRVISATSHGYVIVWNINTNESKPLKDLFKGKVTLTCLSSCPHAGWLLAFGLSDGCVVIADLRRNGQVLYKLRGHYQSVVSLSWCPAPVNIFPRCTTNKVKNKSLQSEIKSEPSTSSGKDENKKLNPWVNLVHADDDDKKSVGAEDLLHAEVNDFLRECDNLKAKILGLDIPVKENGSLAQKKDVSEEKNENIEKVERVEVVQNRPYPKIFDPSGDFFDDSDLHLDLDESVDISSQRDILEEKGGGDHETVRYQKGKTGELDQKEEGTKGKELKPEEKELVSVQVKTDLDQKQNEIKTGQKPEDSSGGVSEKHVALDKLEDTEGTVVGTRKESLDQKKGETKAEQKPDYYPEKEICIVAGKVENSEEADQRTKQVDQIQNETNAEHNSGGLSEKEVSLAATKAETEETSTDTLKEPQNIEEVEEEPRSEYLLASSSKDRSVYIWRAGTDGRMQTFFQVNKRANRRDKKISTYITLCWVSPGTILTSSATGEVIAWPVPKPKDSTKQYKVVHLEHSSLIFNIVTPLKYTTSYNWRDEHSSHIWTWGHDSKLVNYDLHSGKVRFSYTTTSALITCFSTSALDPNRLAIGQRDGDIRIWDLSLPHSNIVTMQRHQQKFMQKISAVEWHPLKEMVLGFGTEEGRAGFIDLIAKKTNLFPHYFHSQVYKVEWGPIGGDTGNLGLYVLSEGKLAIYDMQKPSDDPIQLELPEKLYVHKFAWKPDFTLLLLNGKDGSLTLLKTDLVAVTTVYPNEKGMNAIVWHPDAFTDNTEISPRCNWFAATTAKGVLVFDCTSVEGKSFSDKIVANFEGHLRPPLALAWCPFEGNKIVSTAADGLAHVWDVTTKSAIATFADSVLSNISAVAWSPVDADLIITGDKLLRIWKISKNPPKIDDEFLTTRKRLLAKSPKNEPEKTEKNKIKVDIPKVKPTPRNCIVPALYVSNEENLSSQVAKMRALMNRDAKETSVVPESLDAFQIFGTKEQVANLLDANYLQHQREGKHKSCELISLWKGNVAEYIRNAINENRVTPSIITLAPMVSPKLWQEACITYAKKLSEDASSDPLETAMYFLACHKFEEAINCLCLNNMFKEALALAKHRLPETNETITKVVEKWAQYCCTSGNFENAAYCYIHNKDYENAAKILSRRNNKEFLELALELAEKTGNKELCDSIKFKYEEHATEETELPSRAEVVLTGISQRVEGIEVQDTDDESSFHSMEDIGSDTEKCQRDDTEREM